MPPAARAIYSSQCAIRANEVGERSEIYSQRGRNPPNYDFLSFLTILYLQKKPQNDKIENMSAEIAIVTFAKSHAKNAKGIFCADSATGNRQQATGNRQSGNQAIRQSGNQAIRQSGNQAIRQLYTLSKNRVNYLTAILATLVATQIERLRKAETIVANKNHPKFILVTRSIA
jgi:hypothetical protein